MYLLVQGSHVFIDVLLQVTLVVDVLMKTLSHHFILLYQAGQRHCSLVITVIFYLSHQGVAIDHLSLYFRYLLDVLRHTFRCNFLQSFNGTGRVLNFSMLGV